MAAAGSRAVRVAIVDDHPIVRAGMRAVIEAAAGLEVTGEAADARQTFELVERTRPDVLLLDLDLPGQNGIAVTREVLRRWPATRVLMISLHHAPELVADSFSAGAVGFVFKEQPVDEIVGAIQKVHGGELVVPQVASASLIAKLAARKASREKSVGLGALTAREREIFDLAVQERSNKEIAAELTISIKTVETHRLRINRKLGVSSTAGLVRIAAERGLLRARPPEPRESS